MIASIVISALTVLALIICVLIKPYIKVGKFSIGLYWIVCVVGAILMLAVGAIPIEEVGKGILANTSVNPLKILALFISVTLISIYLGRAGFFDYIANKVFLKAKCSQMQLFLILYAVVAILTIFTSNDIIILTFTAPICIFAKRAKVSPSPYLFAEFIAANTFSTFLIVGNPTNIYLATSYGITFFDYFVKMALPAAVLGVSALLMTILMFSKQLKVKLNVAEQTEMENTPIKVDKAPMIIALVHLVVCIILLAISEYIKVEMYLICVCLFASLFVINLIYEIATKKSVKNTLKTLSHAPFELVPFVLSMFIIVLALSYNGVTALVGDAFIQGGKVDAIIFGYISAFGANLFNNIPMSVLFERIIDGKSIYAVLGTIIGSNVGAIITPLGALAGIMWNKILKSYDMHLSFGKFALYGVPIAIVSVGLSCLALFAI